jgi:hypothetical protein
VEGACKVVRVEHGGGLAPSASQSAAAHDDDGVVGCVQAPAGQLEMISDGFKAGFKGLSGG